MAKTTVKSAAKNTALKTTPLKGAAAKAPALKSAPAKVSSQKTPAPKAAGSELVHSHPTMCLHCHLIVEMFHERGADPVKGAWQCPRCAHKYLFSHWKIKRQARSKSEAA